MFVTDQVIVHVVFEDSRSFHFILKTSTKSILLYYLILTVELHHSLTDYVFQVHENFADTLPVVLSLFKKPMNQIINHIKKNYQFYLVQTVD
jgi:hypothetical protein